MSLKGPDRWLLECLHRGAVGGDPWTETGCNGFKEAAYQHYEQRAREARERPRDAATWSKLCKKALQSSWDSERPSGFDRKRRLKLAPLSTARAAFEKHFGHQIEWETEAAAVERQFANGGEVFDV